MATVEAVPRGSVLRAVVWTAHLAFPLLGLWLLVARPQLDVRWQHNLSHFVMVGVAALIAVAVGLRVSSDAKLRSDSRLYLVGLAFLASAAFFGLHALSTPTVVVPEPNLGFAVATPVGLIVAGLFVVAACLDWDARGAGLMRRASLLRWALLLLVVAWAVVSVLRLPPLDRTPDPAGLETPLVAMAVVGGGLFLIGTLRFWQLHRRRRGAVLLSLLTAWALLAESMVAVAVGPSWQLSWWLWHLTMLLAFVFVAYAAWVQLRLEGRSAGLFDGAGGESTAMAAQRGSRDALERLVGVLEGAATSHEHVVDPAAVTSAVGESYGLTEGQAAVLGQAGLAMAEERQRQRQLRALGAIGAEASVTGEEAGLLALAHAKVAEAFPWCETSLLLRRGDDVGPPARGQSHAVIPLVAKGLVAGWLQLADRGGRPLTDADLAMAGSFASQVGLALENRRLYHELDGLFRSYMSPEVAAALVADPSQANLGGAVQEVTVLFADLRGFTAFSEAHSPAEVMDMLNLYYRAAVPAVLAEGGTVTQFVGDEVMALFNTPVRQPDHQLRAARAGLALQAATKRVALAHAGWPVFRVGINTGPALVGNVGSNEMRNFTAIGDTTNTAARIQSSAEPGSVYLGPTTAAAIGTAMRVSMVGPIEMKGKAEPLAVYRLDEG